MLAQRLPPCSSSLLLLGTELSTKHQNLLFSRCLRAVLSAVLQAGGAAWQAELRWMSALNIAAKPGWWIHHLTSGLFPSVQLLLVQEFVSSAFWGGLGRRLEAQQPPGWYLGL